ncbi:MAG: hypothetical protein AAF495_12325 [Pseudomonadota bacterium]
MTPLIGWSALIATLCVLLCAESRFKGAGGPGGLRWRLAFGGYAACQLALLAGLSLALIGAFHLLVYLGSLLSSPLIANLGAMQAPGAGVVGGSLSPLPMAAPLVAALISIVCLPYLPWAGAIERSTRRFFRALGGVPLPALRLCRVLRRGPSFVPVEVQDALCHRLGEQGLAPDAVLAAPDGTLPALWRRCLTLQVLIEDFAVAHPGFQHRHRQRLEDAQGAATRLARLASLLFDDQETFAEAQSPRLIRRLLTRDLNAHLAELAELAALGLVEGYPEAGDRARELAAWGFGPQDPRVVRLRPRRGDGAAADSSGSVVLPFPASGFAEGKRRIG